MFVCGGHYSFQRAVVIRRISTCFLGAINIQGKEKSSSFLTFVKRVVPATLQGVMPSNLYRTDVDIT